MSLARIIVTKTRKEIQAAPNLVKAMRCYRKYQNYTMIGQFPYINNLMLCMNKAPKEGCIVEAGVWRGGMSAGMADMLPGRIHYLFDSFEGLPPAKEIDGEDALRWQASTKDNCRAEREFADKIMSETRAKQYHLVEGWFSHTTPQFRPVEPIAVLRLDGDWYELTMDCLNGLYPFVMKNGLIIFDDYYTWIGQARALHDYLSRHKSADRIDQWRSVCYMIKQSALAEPLQHEVSPNPDHSCVRI